LANETSQRFGVVPNEDVFDAQLDIGITLGPKLLAPNEIDDWTEVHPTLAVICYHLKSKNHTMGYMRDSSKCAQVDNDEFL